MEAGFIGSHEHVKSSELPPVLRSSEMYFERPIKCIVQHVSGIFLFDSQRRTLSNALGARCLLCVLSQIT